MADVFVRLDLSGLEAFQRALDELGSSKGQQLFSDVLNRVGDRTRTDFRRELVKQSGIPYTKTKTQARRAYPGHLQYTIVQPGGATNVADFHGRQTGWGVAADPWRRPVELHGGFMVRKFQNFAFHRTGSSRLPITPLFGPALSREAMRDGAFAAFQSAPSRLAPAILGQLTRIFGK